MTKEVYEKIQERLERLIGIGQLSYVSEDWGQLDLYDQRPPVTFPCALYDATSVDYEDHGQGRQEGQGTVAVRIADYRARSVSSQSPDTARGFDMIETVQAVYAALQGVGGLTRRSLRKAKRDDGIREFEMIFAFSFIDNTAIKKTQKVKADVDIII